MKKNRALIATVVGLALASVGFSQQYPPPQYPQGQPPPQPQQQYPPQGQQPQYPQQYPQAQYPPAQGYPQQQYPVAAPGQPPLLPPDQLDQLVASIALYPDSLLAHVLTAATVYEQIPEAAGWANQHAYLHGADLAGAIQQDQLPWDVSVLALIPFPQVLSQMAQYMQWTEQLGNAVLAQRPDVMDAIQRLRQRAQQDGYFQDPQFSSHERVVLSSPGSIQIDPIGGDYFVPYYNPSIFFVAPRRGFYAGFSFGPAISVGSYFSPWGWGGGLGFGWRNHSILIGGNNWDRRWVDRDRFNRHVEIRPEHRMDQHGYVPHYQGAPHREAQRQEQHRDNHGGREHDHH